MQADEHYTWSGQVFHQAEPQPNVAALRKNRQTGTISVVIGNIDLPAFVSDGKLYVQAPLPLIFQAFAEDLSAFISDLEVRVSIEGGGTLSLDSDGRPFPGQGVAKPRVVRRGRKS